MRRLSPALSAGGCASCACEKVSHRTSWLSARACKLRSSDGSSADNTSRSCRPCYRWRAGLPSGPASSSTRSLTNHASVDNHPVLHPPAQGFPNAGQRAHDRPVANRDARHRQSKSTRLNGPRTTAGLSHDGRAVSCSQANRRASHASAKHRYRCAGMEGARGGARIVVAGCNVYSSTQGCACWWVVVLVGSLVRQRRCTARTPALASNARASLERAGPIWRSSGSSCVNACAPPA
jgi:hypothetical protein